MSVFSSSKIGIFSDIHLGIHKDSKSWHEVSLKWAEWFISDMKAQGIRDIVFCGDFFHMRDEISVDTLHFGSDLLGMFSDFNLIMITGNHDCYLKDSSRINSLAPFRKWPNINIVESVYSIESYGKVINFIPWGTSLSDIPKGDITFGHFEIKFFKMNTFSLCEDGFTPNEILDKAPLTFSGHFHLRDDRKYKNGNIVYVGNPFQMDFNDAESSKGYYILDLETSDYRFVENTTSPKHTNITLSYLLSEKTINDRVKGMIANCLVKLKIDRRISSDDLSFLINKFKTLKPIQFNVEHESDISTYDMDDEKVDLSGIDIEQALIEFVDLMDINNKSEIINYTLELYKKSK